MSDLEIDLAIEKDANEFINFIEWAVDNNLMIRQEDWNAYLDLVKIKRGDSPSFNLQLLLFRCLMNLSNKCLCYRHQK